MKSLSNYIREAVFNGNSTVGKIPYTVDIQADMSSGEQLAVRRSIVDVINILTSKYMLNILGDVANVDVKYSTKLTKIVIKYVNSDYPDTVIQTTDYKTVTVNGRKLTINKRDFYTLIDKMTANYGIPEELASIPALASYALSN